MADSTFVADSTLLAHSERICFRCNMSFFKKDNLPICREGSINIPFLEILGFAMKIRSPILRGLTLAIISVFCGPAFAGAGGFLTPPQYHPLDNIWKIALTVAVIWIIVRLRRPA